MRGHTLTKLGMLDLQSDSLTNVNSIGHISLTLSEKKEEKEKKKNFKM